MRYFFICFSCLLLQSCFKVGPDFVPPCAPIKGGWIEEGSSGINETENYIVNWWEAFDDPTLNHLIDLAHEENLNLQIACFRIMEARARLGFAIGELFPQEQFAYGGAQRQKVSKNAPNVRQIPSLIFNDYQLGLQASWELDFWGKFRRAIESEQQAFFASYANYDDVLVILLSDVASFYTEIRTVQELIEIVHQNVSIQNRSLEITQAQFDGGFVSELDVQQATTLLRGTEARLPDFERQLREAKNALCVLLGIVPQDLDDLLQGPKVIPKVSSDIFVNAPEDLLCRRPDIRRALFDTASQSARIGVAFSDFFPQVSLTGLIGLESSSGGTMTGGNLLSRQSLTFNYGTNFVWPILNYGRISNRVQEEWAKFYQLVANYENTVLKAYADVENGLIGFLAYQDQVGFLRDSVKAAERATSLANTQYVEGLVDYTRVLNTQESLLNEQEKLALSRGSIALSLIATYKAIGGGWELRCEIN